MKKKRFVFKGSYTIEASFILPMILMIFLVIIYLSFYFHDCAVLSSAAYTSAFRGSQMINGEDIFSQVQFCSKDLIEDRLLSVEALETEIEVNKNEIKVDYFGYINMPFRKLLVNAHGQAKVDNAVDFIRKCRIVEHMMEDKK